MFQIIYAARRSNSINIPTGDDIQQFFFSACNNGVSFRRKYHNTCGVVIGVNPLILCTSTNDFGCGDLGDL